MAYIYIKKSIILWKFFIRLEDLLLTTLTLDINEDISSVRVSNTINSSASVAQNCILLSDVQQCPTDDTSIREPCRSDVTFIREPSPGNVWRWFTLS